MASTPSHTWRFFRAGGFDQVKLESGADLIARKGFDQAVAAILGRTASMLTDIKPQEWQTVMNDLGRRIRAARKAGA